ncbi:MAG: hypothetical protein Q9181_002143 [Wetmoreana brouardii]
MAKRSREDSPPSAVTGSPSFTPSQSQSPSPSLAVPSTTPPTLAPLAAHSTKYLQVSNELEGSSIAMKCSLAPHSEAITFPSFEEFEVHYAQVHTNRCSECQKNFPTDHFLGLHISENHDPLVESRKARGEKTFRCFVEGCDKVCSAPQKRRMHLQAKHYFPKDYDFFIVNDGIDRRSSMLRTRHRRGSSAAARALHQNQKPGHVNHKQPSASEVIQTAKSHRVEHQDIPSTVCSETNSLPKPTTDVDELTSTMSALKFVPPSVRFGRGGRTAGLGRR